MHSSPFSFQLMPLNMHLLRPILFGTTPRCIAPPSTTTLPPPLSPSDLVFLVSFPHVIEAVERRDVPAGVAVLITTELLRNGTTELEDMRFDEWIARDGVRLQRFCLTPEITRVTLLSPRVIPFIPVSELELRQYDGFVPFLEMDFRYLYKRNYEAELVAVLSKAVVIDSIGKGVCFVWCTKTMLCGSLPRNLECTRFPEAVASPGCIEVWRISPSIRSSCI